MRRWFSISRGTHHLISIYKIHTKPNSIPFNSPESCRFNSPRFFSKAPLFSGQTQPPEINKATGEASESEPPWSRIVLPEEFSRNVVVLECESSVEAGVCHVYLVGTAHVSLDSCREVEAVISNLKPDVVFLELCSRRAAMLHPQVPTMRKMVEMWKRNHNLFGIVYSWFLSKVASELKVFPGAEFRVAYEEAKKYGGRVILGDRPVQVTLQRTWGKMPLWHKIKLLYSLFFQAVFLPSPEDLNKIVNSFMRQRSSLEPARLKQSKTPQWMKKLFTRPLQKEVRLKEMDDIDMVTLVIQEMSKEFPTLMETLVHERDKYMSSMLLRIASENSLVVAVVGKGHLQGIRNNWKQPVVMRDLMEIPSKKAGIF